MKLLGGGPWTRGDVLALVGVIVALIALYPAIRSMPSSAPQSATSAASAATLATPNLAQPAPVALSAAASMPTLVTVRREARTRDVTSNQVNFGCEQTLQVQTPFIELGRNPADVSPSATWKDMDNVKTRTQNVERADSTIRGVGSITGRDKEFFNCPGGGHGELTLRVTWTAEVD